MLLPALQASSNKSVLLLSGAISCSDSSMAVTTAYSGQEGIRSKRGLVQKYILQEEVHWS